jgi:Kdo2-lipid IVA lauroyltransferase/acyltransferase
MAYTRRDALNDAKDATPASPAAAAAAPATASTATHRRLLRRVRRDATMLAWHAWQRIDSVLPRPARFAIATGLGELLYWLLPNKRATTLANMRQVLGPDAPERCVRLVAKRSFRNYAKYLSEFTHLPRWGDDDLERLMTSVEGWEHIEDALADGKGAVFVTPHFGNWDVAGWYFGKRHRFSAVAEPLEPPELDALVQGWRQAKHISIIPLANGARGVLRALKQGGLVALVADRPTHRQGEGAPVVFFGAWTRVPAGAAHFALKTGAPVVAVGVWRTPRNTYAGVALPPLRFAPTGDFERDVNNAMQRVIADVETIIRAHPDQWYMFRRMWPERPATAGVPEAPGLAPGLAPLAGEAAQP